MDTLYSTAILVVVSCADGFVFADEMALERAPAGLKLFRAQTLLRVHIPDRQKMAPSLRSPIHLCRWMYVLCFYVV
jgi:hypothetical protein